VIPSAARADRRRHRQRGGTDGALPPILFLAPAFVLSSVFVYYAIAESIRLSFYEWDGIGSKVWIGLGNYEELFSDPVFRKALLNNARWVVLLGVLAPVLGLAFALLLGRLTRAGRLLRALFLLPFVISQVVIGLIFGWFFHTEFGLLNQILEALGFARVAPLESERWAIYAVIAAALWPQSAYCMILYLTGLTAVRRELVDAARLDGAGGWRMLWHVILPQLRPVNYIVLMVCVVSALRSFDLVMIMTLGGPHDSSTVLAFYMYEQVFTGFRYGYGAAIAAVLFALMWLCIAVALWRMLRREAR
jgi:multiple sugar transport system permease protein